MIPSKESVEALAAETGFRHDMLEKSIHLLSLLNVIFEDSFLKDRLVLKGGTALNLFHFKLPRLSIDIDFNYIGSHELAVMKEEREKVESLTLAIAKSLKLAPTKIPADHACRKYTATYHSNFAGRGNVQIDINYLHRVCYFPPEKNQFDQAWELHSKRCASDLARVGGRQDCRIIRKTSQPRPIRCISTGAKNLKQR